METRNKTTDRPMKSDAGKFNKERKPADNLDLDMMDGDEGMDLGGYDIEKDRKMFSKKKSCWFCAKKTAPDWKDTGSYSWLVNEFGKISPARVSGLCPKHQRAANTSIKRGRHLGLISYISNHVAR